MQIWNGLSWKILKSIKWNLLSVNLWVNLLSSWIIFNDQKVHVYVRVCVLY